MNNDFEKTIGEPAPENIIPDEQADFAAEAPAEEDTSTEKASASDAAKSIDLSKYSPNGSGYGNTPKPVKKRWWTGGKIVAFIAIILGCLIIGTVFGFILGVTASTVADIDINEILPDNIEDITENIPSEETNPIPGLSPDERPTDMPVIGGAAPVITDTANPVPEIAEATSPGVVIITMYDTVLDDNKEEIYTPVSYSAGTIISQDGYIVTNEHVVASGNSILVTLYDGTEHEAVLVGTDPYMDLAVIKISPATPLAPVAIGDSDKCRVGDYAISIGNPVGAGEMLPWTVTVGHIGAVNREMLFNNFRQNFIQIDTPINPGNSGGPLLNGNGECIGFVTWKSLISSYSEYGDPINTEGVGFAIPINSAMESIESIMLTGERPRAGLGISFYEFGKDAAEQAGIDITGIEIADFLENSPCEAAGIRIGDIITHMDGEPIISSSEFAAEVQSKNVGDQVTFTVFRKDQGTFDVVVTLIDLNK